MGIIVQTQICDHGEHVGPPHLSLHGTCAAQESAAFARGRAGENTTHPHPWSSLCAALRQCWKPGDCITVLHDHRIRLVVLLCLLHLVAVRPGGVSCGRLRDTTLDDRRPTLRDARLCQQVQGACASHPCTHRPDPGGLVLEAGIPKAARTREGQRGLRAIDRELRSRFCRGLRGVVRDSTIGSAIHWPGCETGAGVRSLVKDCARAPCLVPSRCLFESIR
mmetsp:Transcript_38189/g.86059  ORF Transcript_38189/g.86059 Transcript_38189/m.86059 type:complete len:221 (+) Transcript_38189:601-1263(+)